MASSLKGAGVVVERRRYPRKNIIESQLLTADVTLGQGGRTPPQRGIVIDLSEGGMAIQPFLPLAAGAVGEVRLELPGATKILAGRGMVAWVGNGGRTGIRFIDVPPEVRSQLRAWLHDPCLHEEARSLPSSSESVPAPRADEIDFQAALQLIAERAQVITGATGAAIAIGDSNGMVCRASCGNAPDPGVHLRPGGGLSGYCLSSSEIVYCADTQSDLRVDAAAARQLGLGSIIVVPIFATGRLAGLLEVLATRRNAFNPRQMTRLERFSELLGAAIEEYQRGRSFVEHPAETQAGNPTSTGKGSESDKDSACYYDPTAPVTESTSEAKFVTKAESDLLFHQEKLALGPIKPVASARVPSATTPPDDRDPLAWHSCLGCGHQNPPWARACENCHRMLAAAVIASTEVSTTGRGSPEPAPGVLESDRSIPLSSYAAPRRAGRVLTIGLIIALLLCALMLIAGWYVGRERAVPAGASSASKAKVESQQSTGAEEMQTQPQPASPASPGEKVQSAPDSSQSNSP